MNQDVFCFLVVCAPFRNVGVPLFLAAAPTTGRVHTVLFAPLNHVVSGRARLRVLSHPGTLIFHQLDISPWSDCVTFLREMWRAVIVLLPHKKSSVFILNDMTDPSMCTRRTSQSPALRCFTE